MFSFSLSFNGMSNKINCHIKRSRLFQYRHKFKGYSLNAGGLPVLQTFKSDYKSWLYQTDIIGHILQR